MNNVFSPKAMRHLVILAATFLVASLLVSGVNAYVAFASPARSQSPNVPLKVGFEGQLSDSTGSPVTGSKTLTFNLYDEATGTHSPLWTEQQTVTVTNGLYTVQLGSITALQASYFQGSRWLGIQVQGDANELSPRIPISSVPFALNAKLSEDSISSEGLQGNPVSSATPYIGQQLLWNGSVWGLNADTDGSTYKSISANSTTETTVLTKTIPGNSLSSTGYFTAEFWTLANRVGGSGIRPLTFNIKFGSKVLTYSVMIGLDNATHRDAIWSKVLISNAGDTGVQNIVVVVNNAANITPGDESGAANPIYFDTATIDTTSDQTFQITTQEGGGNGTLTVFILGSRFDSPFLSQ